MRRTMGWATFALALVTLTLGPWLGFARATPRTSAAPPRSLASYEEPVVTQQDEPTATGVRRRVTSACNCRTVDIKMRNFVSDAKVTTGDAKVVNFDVTYVSAGYGDREVEVDQEAEANSGDAIAGQIIGVDARGPTCVNVRVNAHNRVEDSTVQSGDATAINRSVVLLDPGLRRGDLDIDVEQEAEAHSGDAIAGQVIGITNAGAGRKGCGGVDLNAVNLVRRTKVRTGRASFYNQSDILTCAQPGCAAELRRLFGSGADIEMCADSRCRRMRRDDLGAVLDDRGAVLDDRGAVLGDLGTVLGDLGAVLTEPGPRFDPEGETHDDDDAIAECSAVPTDPAVAAKEQRQASPSSAEPASDPAMTPPPEPPARPTPPSRDAGSRQCTSQSEAPEPTPRPMASRGKAKPKH